MPLSKETFNKIDSEFKEQCGFFEVFKSSFKNDPIKKGTFIIFIFIFIGFIIMSYPISLSNKTTDLFSQILDKGFDFSIGILGFLIAGFTIYSTMIDKDLVYILILTKNKENKSNSLITNYLIFFKPFGIFLILLFLCLTYKFFLSVWCSLDYNKILSLFLNNKFVLNIFISIVISSLFLFILISIYSLKIFIFNIYNSTKSISRLELYRKNLNLESYINNLEDNYKNSTNDASDLSTIISALDDRRDLKLLFYQIKDLSPDNIKKIIQIIKIIKS